MGYNPYRKENGEFATKEEAGAKASSDYDSAVASGDNDRAKEVGDYVVEHFPKSKKAQEILTSRYNPLGGAKKTTHPSNEAYDDRINDIAAYDSSRGLSNGDEAYRLGNGGYITEEQFKQVIPDEGDRLRYTLWANGCAREDDSHADDAELQRRVDEMFDNDRAEEFYYTEIDDADFDEDE